MSRVVVTGLGVVSSIGNDCEAAARALRDGRSGIVHFPAMGEIGYRSQVYGPVRDLDDSSVPKTARQTMSSVAVFAAVAALEAIRDAKLGESHLRSPRCSVVVGTGAGGTTQAPVAEQVMEQHRKSTRAGGVGPVKIMDSTASANLAALLGVEGRAYSLSAACATGLYNIGHAYELIQFGAADVCITGSAEEATWRILGATSDNTRAMPTEYNARPAEACRPYDAARQGFVLAEGAGVVILESLEHAERRGARIYAEIMGYGAANDGADILLFQPTGQGLESAIGQALGQAAERGVTQIDYINTHGVGSMIGDPIEVDVMRRLLGDRPHVGSTKSLSGHSMGAAAAQEAVFTLLMMDRGFVAATANLKEVAEDCRGVNHVAGDSREAPINAALTFNAGLGGVNAAMVLSKW